MKAKITAQLLKELQAEGRAERFEVWDETLRGFVLRCSAQGMSFGLVYRTSDGRKRRVTLGKHPQLKPKPARDMALELLASVAKGADPAQAKRSARKAQTFEQFIEEHYGPWLETERKAGREIRRALVKSFPDWQGKKLSDVSLWLAEKWRKGARERGLSLGSRNRYLTYVKAAMARAKAWGFVSENPLAGLQMEREDYHVIRFLSDAEETALYTALEAREAEKRAERKQYNAWRAERHYTPFPEYGNFVDFLQPLVTLAMNTGCRRGELLSLTWQDVNLEGNTLTIRGETTKTAKGRTIPLNQTARDVLTRWKADHSEAHGLVFPSPRTGKRMDNFKTSWAALLKAANISSFRFHDCRHCFASRLVQSGVDLFVVGQLLGHGSIEQTMKYSHLKPENLQDAVSVLDVQSSNVVDIADAVQK